MILLLLFGFFFFQFYFHSFTYSLTVYVCLVVCIYFSNCIPLLLNWAILKYFTIHTPFKYNNGGYNTTTTTTATETSEMLEDQQAQQNINESCESIHTSIHTSKHYSYITTLTLTENTIETMPQYYSPLLATTTIMTMIMMVALDKCDGNG